MEKSVMARHILPLCGSWKIVLFTKNTKPADKKWFTRAVVADIITSRINEMKIKIPKLPEEELAGLLEARKGLEKEG
jgi:hypothetical protein